MDSTAANEFVGSPVFISLTVIVLIGIAIALRLAFRTSDKEYVHKQEE